MIDDMWPDLSSWYPLPEGGTIPKGMRCALLHDDGDITVFTTENDWTPVHPERFRTERPAPVPLPTELGARIIAYGPWGGPVELTLLDGAWTDEIGGFCYDIDDITRWMPATEWRSTL